MPSKKSPATAGGTGKKKRRQEIGLGDDANQNGRGPQEYVALERKAVIDKEHSEAKTARVEEKTGNKEMEQAKQNLGKRPLSKPNQENRRAKNSEPQNKFHDNHPDHIKEHVRCVYCGNLFTKGYLRKHVNRCPKNPSCESLTRRCKFCEKELSVTYIQRHEDQCTMNPDHDPASLRTTCQFCGNLFTKEFLRKHRCPKNPACGSLKKPCQFCEKEFAVTYIQQHEKECSSNPHHDPSSLTKNCQFCGKLYTVGSLRKHVTSCSSNPDLDPSSLRTNCQFCGNLFTKDYLRKHVKRCPKNPACGSLKIICKFCEKEFSVTHIQQHVAKCRSNPDHDPLSIRRNCEFCGTLYTVDSLRKHVVRCPKNPIFLESPNQIETGTLPEADDKGQDIAERAPAPRQIQKKEGQWHRTFERERRLVVCIMPEDRLKAELWKQKHVSGNNATSDADSDIKKLYPDAKIPDTQRMNRQPLSYADVVEKIRRRNREYDRRFRKSWNEELLKNPNRAEILEKKRQQARYYRRRYWNSLTDSQRNAFRAKRSADERRRRAIRVNCHYCNKELQRQSMRQHVHMHTRNAEKLIPLTQQEREQVERDTRQGSLSKDWRKLRYGSLTSTRVRKVVKRRASTDPYKLVGKITKASGSGFQSQAMIDGLKMEPEVVQLYRQHMNIDSRDLQYPVGYHVHEKYGFIGATPDAIVRKEGCVEVKCPIVAVEDVPIRKSGDYLKRALKGESYGRYLNRGISSSKRKLRLHRNHTYFSQCVTQIQCTNSKYCDFVVYFKDKTNPTKYDLWTERIFREEADEEWKIYEPKLIEFYQKYIGPPELIPEVDDLKSLMKRRNILEDFLEKQRTSRNDSSSQQGNVSTLNNVNAAADPEVADKEPSTVSEITSPKLVLVQF